MVRRSEENSSFQNNLQFALNKYLEEQKSKFPENEILKIDLHCHDYNSNVPDELLGRVLNVPETWLPTESLIASLEKNGSDAITITNHNNADSCFNLIEQGIDVLVGAEFTVYIPDFDTSIHVLTYGFTKEQEKRLKRLRKNIYKFLMYARENNIPTIWAHPLFCYKPDGLPDFDFFSKMVLIFERFEVLNGQRDTWQNMLVKVWLEGITKEQIDQGAEKYGITLRDYCSDPYRKALSGGSDSHMGIFAGQTGTALHVPDLPKKLKTTPRSALVLDAIREGRMAPYGAHQNFEKLTIAFLDYVFQIALYKNDPGLFRILLHKGSSRDKILALLISNAFSELHHHKVTMRFVELFHQAFLGSAPNRLKRWMVPKDYKPIFNEAIKIAKAHNLQNGEMVSQFYNAVNTINSKLNEILFSRLSAKVGKLFSSKKFTDFKINELIEKLEIPSDLRSFISPDQSIGKPGESVRSFTNINVSSFLDNLSFPFLASSIILGANFTSSRVLYNNRPFLEEFSRRIGQFEHPKRMLWLTDTFQDKNGVSMVLKDIHKEIKKRDLPIDIMVCSSELEPEDHLIVVKPMTELDLPFYKEQPIRIPNFNEIHSLFLENEYDRIICSTEGIMGLAAIFLKNAYSVPAHFYVHTDWTMFARKVLNLDRHNVSRVQRFMRLFYGAFDKLFVLNTDHQKWLTGEKMNFDANRVCLTAHWVDRRFAPQRVMKEQVFNVKADDKVLLFAGRLSHEKGVLDIADIYPELKTRVKNLKVVFAGTGPAEELLKKAIPEAIFMGWVDNSHLPEVYSSADLLILPSKFDTFSCVVLEAISCGLPVVTYNSKGPKDIIRHQKCGYLAAGKKEMVTYVSDHLNDTSRYESFKNEAIKRSKDYQKQVILDGFLRDVNLS